ncbi:YveK family protein [Aerococcus sanguinicola]
MAKKQRKPLTEILKIMKNKLAFIIMATVIGMILASLISFLVLEPKYEGTAQVIVHQNTEEQTTAPLADQAKTLTDTYKEIIVTPAVLEPVAQGAEEDLSYQALRDRVRVTTNEESLVLQIAVVDHSPYTASNLANQIASSFGKQVNEIYPNSQVKQVADAKTHTKKIRPKPVWDILIGGGLAFLLASLWALWQAYRDKTVRSEEIVSEMGWLLFGVLPEMSQTEVRETRFKRKGRSANYDDNKRRI